MSKLTNEKLKEKYNTIYTEGGYESFFTFNAYDILSIQKIVVQ